MLLALCACQDRLPGAPSDLTRGIVVYEHANFLGESALITESVEDLKDFRGPCVRYETSGSGSGETKYSWDDCISSVRVAPGWEATLYRDDDFDGQSLRVSADVDNLQLVSGTCDHEGLNDCVTSIKLFRP
jgi:hypothetical protein